MPLVLDPSAVAKTWRFLGTIVAIEAIALLLQPATVARALTMRADAVPPAGWLLAAAVACAYVLYAVRALDLARYLTARSAFRWLGPIIAVPSGILEEGVFRMTLMNVLAHQHQGIAVQILVSALAFGAVHAVWGVRAGMRAALGAMTATCVLGALLACVFVISGRALLPCALAHFAINLVLEPWMGYAFALRAQGASVMVVQDGVYGLARSPLKATLSISRGTVAEKDSACGHGDRDNGTYDPQQK